MENTSLFNDEGHANEMTDDKASTPGTLNMTNLKNYAERLLIPFLRIASLVKHNVYEQELPDIDDDNEEFDHLIKFLDLSKHPEIKLDEVSMDQSLTLSTTFHGK